MEFCWCSSSSIWVLILSNNFSVYWKLMICKGLKYPIRIYLLAWYNITSLFEVFMCIFSVFFYSCMKTNAWIENQINGIMHWTSLDKMWSPSAHADLLFMRIGPFKYVKIAVFGRKRSQNDHVCLFKWRQWSSG